MPFNIGAAAAHISDRVVIRFNEENLVLKYNAGEKFAEYQRVTTRKQAELTELMAKAERAERGESKDSDDTFEELQRQAQRARRDLCDNICLVIEEWDLDAPEDYDRTKIREKYLAGLSDEEKKDLSKEDLKELKGLDGPGPVPVSGIWLHALPLPDQFILGIVEAIGEDFDSGGSGSKKR